MGLLLALLDMAAPLLSVGVFVYLIWFKRHSLTA